MAELSSTITAEDRARLDESFAGLTDASGDVAPISDAERAARRARLGRLLSDRDLDALVIEPGTTSTEIGARRPAAIVIDRPEVSSRHAAIECVRSLEGPWTLAVLDRASTNGTFVNGERVERRELTEGDRIRFASVEYELCFLES